MGLAQGCGPAEERGGDGSRGQDYEVVVSKEHLEKLGHFRFGFGGGLQVGGCPSFPYSDAVLGLGIVLALSFIMPIPMYFQRFAALDRQVSLEPIGQGVERLRRFR